jgi:hypothetical protein
MTTPKKKEKQPTEQQIAQRRDEWLRRTLNTPPKPHKEVVAERKSKRGGKAKP